jgi:hypothetical protein
MQGYLAMADISGYTMFLTSSELEHAQDILSALMRNLTECLGRGLVLSKLEGDAILTYSPAGSLQNGQAIIDLLESVYTSFRKQREAMQINTTCTCRACANIPTLDLKFFVHYGEFLLADIAGYKELSGTPVILVHRLLKNDSSKQAGLNAYMMLSDSALEAMDLPEFSAGLIHSRESYEHLGEVGISLYDLHPVWESERKKRHIFVSAEQAGVSVSAEVPVPPGVAWEVLTNPTTRTHFSMATNVSVSGLTNGRIQTGATYHCAHQEGETPQLILDWQPVEYLTIQSPLMLLAGQTVTSMMTTWLHPVEGGTRVEIDIQEPQVDEPSLQPQLKLMWETQMREQVRFMMEQSIQVFVDLVNQKKGSSLAI